MTRLDKAMFAEEVFDTRDLLENSIDWIQTHMCPEAVFSTEDLDTWALDNGYVKLSEQEEVLG